MLQLNHLINQFIAGDPKLWLAAAAGCLLLTLLWADAMKFLLKASLFVGMFVGVAIGALRVLGAQ